MKTLYPLKFKPIFKDKIWGGDKIKTKLGLDFGSLPNCGEAWVASGVEGNQTKISNGFLEGNDLNEVLEIYMDDLVGERVFEQFGNEFPLLVKFIDATDYLSIQVHPDDALAASRGIGNGKTEMWYILDADKDSELISGFNQVVDRDIYLKSVENGTLKDILNVEKVSAGDVFYIPSGRVHALGPGILLAEIQQTSDTTYRIYDWDRVDDQGNGRELHTELALDAIDFTFHESYRTNYPRVRNKTMHVIESPYFTTNILDFNEPMRKDYSSLDSFVLYVCVGGASQIHYENGMVTLTMGEVILIPATIDDIFLVPEPNSKILEVYIV